MSKATCKKVRTAGFEAGNEGAFRVRLTVHGEDAERIAREEMDQLVDRMKKRNRRQGWHGGSRTDYCAEIAEVDGVDALLAKKE